MATICPECGGIIADFYPAGDCHTCPPKPPAGTITNPLREIERLRETLASLLEEAVWLHSHFDYSDHVSHEQIEGAIKKAQAVLNTPASQAGEGTGIKLVEDETMPPGMAELRSSTGDKVTLLYDPTPSPHPSAPESPALEALIVRFICGKGNAWNQVDEEAVQAARVEATRRTVPVDVRKCAEEIHRLGCEGYVEIEEIESVIQKHLNGREQ